MNLQEKKKKVPQCKNCQTLKATVFKTPKCVKYSEGHTSLNCPKSMRLMAKCGEERTSN